MPIVERAELLFQNPTLSVERRNIRLDDGAHIVRELIVHPIVYVVFLIREESGRILLRPILHPGNVTYYWGLPRAEYQSPAAVESLDLPSAIAAYCQFEDITVRELVRGYEDATIVAAHHVTVFEAAVRRASAKPDALWLGIDEALGTFTADNMTDVMTLAGITASVMTERGAIPTKPQVALPSFPDITVVTETTRFEGRAFSVVEQTLRLADGSIRSETIVRRPDTVIALPIDRSGAIFLREYFAGTHTTPYGLVGGRASRTSSPAAIADEMQRELREEIGYKARLTRLASCHSTPLFTRIIHQYIATDLVSAPLVGDEDHDVGATSVPLERLRDHTFLADLVVVERTAVTLAVMRLSQ